MLLGSLVVFAQSAPGGGGMQTIALFAMIAAVMYFVMIRPQQKQVKEHRELVAALKKGDDVVTQSGIFGKVHAVTDKIITLEIANGVRVRILKTSIQGKTNLVEEAAAPKGDEKKEEK